MGSLLRGSRMVVLGVVIVAAAAAGYWYWTKSQGGGLGGFTYDTQDADRGSLSQTVTASGRVEALITVEVGSQLSGQIKEIHADFNDVVTEGQLLALLDPDTFATRVASAEADLAVARSNVLVQQSNVTKAEALLAQARREKERQEALANRGNVSQSALDQARTAVATAESDLEVAKAQLDNARSNVVQREASLSQAQLDLDRTQIRSPINGVVISRNVDVGQTVAASLQAPILFTIAQDLSKIQIEASVNEADVGRVLSGNPVSFTVDAFPERPFQGVVKQVRLAPIEEQNVVTYTVIVEADNPGQRLYPGMTATASIITGQRDDVRRVPTQALRFWPPGIERPDQAARFRQMGEAFQAVLDAELTFTDEQKAQIQQMQEERRARRQQGGGGGGRRAGGGGGGGFDPARIRGFMVDRMRAGLDPILTEAQKAKFTEIEDALKTGDFATVWVLEGGAPQMRHVITGLSDGRMIEVRAGGIEAGDKIIIRARQDRSE